MEAYKGDKNKELYLVVSPNTAVYFIGLPLNHGEGKEIIVPHHSFATTDRGHEKRP